MTTSLILFQGEDTNGTYGLWVTNGTAAGTSEISIDAYPNGIFGWAGFAGDLTPLGQEVLFSGLDQGLDGGPVGSLWVTNGTAAGTSELEYALNVSGLTVFGSEVLFDGAPDAAYATDLGDLWTTNGTVAGTSEISVAGASANGLQPSNFAVLGSEVLFAGVGADTNNVSVLWVTKGTAATTSEISTAAPTPQDLTTFGNEVLFASNGNLWITNGTAAGTSELSTYIFPSDITVFGSKALFNSSVNDSGVTYTDINDDLWITDGTAAGTSEISVAGAYSTGVDPADITVLGTKVLFNGEDANGNLGLWVTNGTAAGTSELSIAGAYDSGYGIDPSSFAVLGSELLFQGLDANDLSNLWITNGTAAGTSELSGISGAAMTSSVANPIGLTVLGNKVLFGETSGGLWITNGTKSGTSLISATATPFSSEGVASATPIVFGSEVLFGAKDPSEYYSDYALWVTNGTAAGTSELSSIAGAYGAGIDLDPEDLTILGKKVLFVGEDKNFDGNLWVTNGTESGTSELSVAGAAASGLFADPNDTSFAVSDLLAFGSEVLFEGDDASGNGSLWVTNGTAVGTSELSIAGASAGGLFYGPDNPANPYSSPDLTVFGGKVFFTGIDANGNSGLWVTNGTGAGTSELSIAGAYGSGYGIDASAQLEPHDNTWMKVFGSEMLFNGTDAYGDYGLWVTNGTAAGTSELSIAGAFDGGYDLDPTNMTVFSNEVLLNGLDEYGDRGLWVSNGTAAGTSELSVAGQFTTQSYYTGIAGLNPTDFVVLGSEALFSGVDSDGRRELWITNGTAAGTSEIFPQLYSTLAPSDLAAFSINLVTVSSGQSYTVSSGVTDGGDQILTGGVEIVLSGGATNDATVSDGGTLNISSGGSATAATVAGTVNVYNGGNAVDTTVASGGDQVVSSGGIVSNTSILAGGSMTVLYGGHADPTTVGFGGQETISSGGTDTGAQISGLLFDYGSALDADIAYGGSAVIEQGGTTSGTTVSDGGTLIVSSGGSVSDVTVSSGGTAEFIGVQPTGVTVANGGNVVESNSGSLTSLAYAYVSGTSLYVNSYDLTSPIAFTTLSSELTGNISVTTNADGSFNVFWTSGTASNGKATYSGFENSYAASGALISSATLVSNAVAANGAELGGALTDYFDAVTNGAGGNTPFYAFENNGNFYVTGSGTGQIGFASGTNIGNISVAANSDNTFEVFWTTATTNGSTTTYTATEDSYSSSGTLTSSRQIGSQYSFTSGSSPVAGDFFDADGNNSGGYAYAYRNGNNDYVATNSIATPIQFASGTTIGDVSVSLNADGSFTVLWTSGSTTNQNNYTAYEDTFSASGSETSSVVIGNYSLSEFFYTNIFDGSTASLGAVVIAAADKAETASLTIDKDTSGNITTTAATGVINFTDSDTSQLPVGSIVAQTATATKADGSTLQLTSAQIAALEAAFTMTAAAGNTNNGAIDWTYNPDGTQLDFLTEGQTATITSTVRVSGQSGGSDTATVTVTIAVPQSSIFTAGANTVNFNNLTTTQKAAIAAGADLYDGLGGSDVVTLPNVANYNESVGSGLTLDWNSSAEQPFSTDSRPGDIYTVSGGNGDYYIDAGAGTDDITISGGGTSFVKAGTGTLNLTVSGGGAIVLDVTSGSTASGSITIGGDSEIAVDGAISATVSFAGSATLLLDSGDLKTTTLSITSGGVVSGTGTLSATITNAGTIKAGADDVLEVDGAIANSKWIEAAGQDAEVDVDGNVTNTFAGLIWATGAGAHVNLEGSIVSGGTFETTSGGVINVGDPESDATADVTLEGTSADPVNNIGMLVVTDGSALKVSGLINNTGVISLGGDGSETDLEIVGSFSLQGAGGKVTLSDSVQNQIVSNDSPATLTNVNNTIVGAGTIGDDNLRLINASGGVIDGNSANNTLTLDTSGSITNSGTLEGTAIGGLVISSAVTNSRLVEAIGTGATVLIEADITNTTSGIILASGTGAEVDLDDGVTVSGGTLETANGGVINVGDPNAATPADVTLEGTSADPVRNTGTLVVTDGSKLEASGIIDNTGTISLAGDSSETDLEIAGSFSLQGSGGEVTLSDSDQNQIVSNNSSATLTNVNNTIAGAGTIGDDNLTLVNDGGGMIDGNSANTLTLDAAGGITNSGTFEGTAAGGLVISSDVTNSKLIEAIGTSATVLIEADVTNTTSGIILASGAGANVNLDDGTTVSGGTLETANDGVINVGDPEAKTTADVTLEGTSADPVKNTGTLIVTDGSTLELSGVVDNTGTISLAGDSSETDLEIAGSFSLQGSGGKVTLSDSDQNQIVSNNSSATLTNVNNTIAGAGTIGDDNLTLVNDGGGVIEGSSAASTLTLDAAGGVTNLGTLEGTAAGGLVISSAVTNSRLIEAIGNSATVLIEAGIINTTSGTILASGTGAKVNLIDGSTVSGGTLKTSNGGVINVVDPGADTTDDVTLQGSSADPLNNTGVLIVNDGSTLEVSGIIKNTGTISLAGSSSETDLEIVGSFSLQGSGGKVSLSNSSQNQIVSNNSSATLTNVNNTITGAGTIGDDNLTLINAAGGVIDGNSATTLTLAAAGSITNSGTLEGAAAGGLVISSAVTNSKLIEAIGTGATVLIEANVTNTTSGVILASGAGAKVNLDGTVISGGTLRTLAGGIIQTVSGSTDNSIVAATVAAGALIEVTSATELTLSGTVVDSGTISAMASGADLEVDGIVTVASGGLLGGLTNSDVVVSGTVNVLAGGKFGFGLLSAGGTLNVSAGGAVHDITVSSGGALNIRGTVTSDVTVFSGDVATVSSGGVVSGSNVSSTVISGGEVDVLSGGRLAFATVSSGGELNVSKGGSAASIVVSSSGNLSVAGATTGNVTVLSGGTETVSSGGVASGTGAAGTTISGGEVDLLSGGRLAFATVSSGGSLVISSGASAANIIVSSGGDLNVAGSTTSNVTVLSGGTETISSGGAANGVAGSGTSIAGGELDVQGGGTVAFAVVSSGGVLNLSSGGKAHDITVSSGGNFNVAGTTTSNITTASGGVETVSSGGVVSSGTKVLNGGSLDVLDGGTVIGTIISSGGVEIVSSGGFASGGTVLSGGELEVLSGGSESGVVFSSGALLGVGSGTVVQVSAGVTSGGVVVTNSGTLDVLSGGVAHNITVSSGGTFNLAGTTTSAVTVSSGGYETVSSGGVAGGTTIAGGTLEISSAGSDGGKVTFAASTGTLQLASTTFSGTVAGMTGEDAIDLRNFSFAATQVTSSITATSATLTVTDGAQIAHVILLGNYMGSTFTPSSDGFGGTSIVDPHVSPAQTVSLAQTHRG